jgi:hypothetical protein
MCLENIQLKIFNNPTPLYGYAQKQTRLIGINNHDNRPRWRKRLALMHEILHFAEYDFHINEQHLILHYVAIYLLICKQCNETNVTPTDFTLMFKQKTIFSAYHMVCVSKKYDDFISELERVIN